MDIKATLITSSANVEAARATTEHAAFSCALSASGEAPATHYVASGIVPAEAMTALAELCAVTTGEHDPHAVIAAAGLQLIYPA